jgi:hypothetical protein
MKKLALAVGLCVVPLAFTVPAHATTTPARVGAPHIMRIPRGGVRAAAVPAGAQLTYHGGRVVSNVQVVQVLWGSASLAPEVSGTGVGSVAAMYSNVITSSHMDWLTQYNTPVSPAGTGQTIGRGTYAGRYTITPSSFIYGPTINDSAVQQELIDQIAAGRLPAPTHDAGGNTNTFYAIFFPHGVTITSGTATSCVDFYAYHGTIAASLPAHPELYYAVQADMQLGSSCDTTPTHSVSERTALETSVATHEMVEAITDPEVGIPQFLTAPLAWYDDTNGEIGDICNGNQGGIAGNDGNPYTVQEEFSNIDNDCIVAPVAVLPTIATVTRGTSRAIAIGVSGPAGSVSLAVTGAPLGVTPVLTSSSLAAGSTTTLTINTAPTTTPGHYKVTLTGTEGSVAHSTFLDLTIAPNKPGPPRNVTALPLKGAATASWAAPVSNGGGAITKYTVTASPGAHSCTTTGALHCNVLGLTNGGTYRFSVKATNSAGAGAASPSSAPIVVGIPGAPRSLHAAFPAKGTATITWAAPLSIGSGAISSYQARWSGNGGITWTPWVSTGLARSASRTALAKGHAYRVQVRAVNHSGAGPSAPLTFTQTR